MILVTTAGKVGAAAARELAQHGESVRVLVRDPARVEDLASIGVEVVLGDLAAPLTVDAAVRGVEVMVLVSPAVPELELNVVASAVRAGVGHVIKITSEASADSPIARRRDQAAIEDGLLAAGLDWTLLRNNAYMQNFLMLAPAIATGSQFGSSTGGGRIGMVDTRDVAATIMSKVLRRTVTFHELTFRQQKQAMVDVGVPEPVAQMNVQAMDLFGQGDCDWTTDVVPSILGRPSGNFEQFITDHVAAFG